MFKLVYLVTFISLSSVLSAAVSFDELKADVEVLLKRVTNQEQHKKVLSSYADFEGTSLYEPLTVVGLLGARLHKDLKSFQIYETVLRSKLKNTPSRRFLDVKTLSEECSSCEGTAQRTLDCVTCKGTGDCRNSKCKDGKTVGNEYVEGKFTIVEKDCPTCSAVGSCGKCMGEGKVNIRCSKCKMTGYKYSSKLVLELYEQTLNSLSEQIVIAKQKAEDDAKIAKGMVKIDGEWYTKEQISQMERDALEARRKADLAERRAMEMARQKKLNDKANSLFVEVEKNFYKSPKAAISAIMQFKELNKDFPDQNKLDQELSFCRLILKAKEWESKGAMSKAIKIYQQALLVKEHLFVSEKIKQLDNETIGL